MTTIYYNPRCSKSRATLEILVTQGIEPTVIMYLDHPPDADTLKSITKLLDCSISDIIRKGEELYKELELDKPSLSEEALIKMVVQHPRLLERPIVVNNGKAAVGRPPENVLSIL